MLLPNAEFLEVYDPRVQVDIIVENDDLRNQIENNKRYI